MGTMIRPAQKLQHFELCIKLQTNQEVITRDVMSVLVVGDHLIFGHMDNSVEVGILKILADNHRVCFAHALREAIGDIDNDPVREVEALKSLGDLNLEKGKLSKDSAEFDKAAALYAAALECCKDLEMKQTLEDELEHSKVCRQLLQGYSPQYQWSQDYRGTCATDNSILRVAEICNLLDKSIEISKCAIEQTYSEMLVTAITSHDVYLELEILKSLGDFYLEKGKKRKCLYQLSQAAGMYQKALTKCEDHDTKQVLMHRMEYTKERWLRPVFNKVEEPLRRHLLETFLKDDITAYKKFSPDQASQYTDHLKEGDSSLARSDLDSAEQHFAAALQMIHIRAQQYQREVEPLCKLGDVYSKRGQQTGDGGDFVKAAALYNAAIARSEDQVLNSNIEIGIKEVEKSFLKCTLGIYTNLSQDDTEKHKKQLKEMRDQIKLEMETIDQQLDPYVHDEDDPCVREIEAKRAQAVRQLFEKIAQQRKEFISLLVEECIGLMGPPPCKYALIGLGSQATGLVTPYSDLEFAILEEKESEECLVYFRNLTHYLHLKVVNMGETILPALGIKSLNDFYSENPLDNWYYDSVTPRGFAFDGSMPKASKTPLGRQGTKNKPPSELICTPENMVSLLQNDVTLHLKEGYHLATILRNPCLIAGDQDLIDTFKDITGKILQADGGKMAQQLVLQTLRENMESYRNDTVLAMLIDVKKEIYRFPAVLVDCLALFSVRIIPTTVWETIEEMENQQVISPNNAHHLTVLTSISAELRLRTYMANGGQKENLSAMASMEATMHEHKSSIHTNDNITKVLKPVFHLPSEKQLFRYYHTAVPLKSFLFKGSGERSGIKSSVCFYDNSSKVQGMMYANLCKYELAIRYFHKALVESRDEDSQKVDILRNLGDAVCMLGDYQKAISYYKQALQIYRSIYGQTKAHPHIASLLNSLGLAWNDLGDYRKAISYHEQALQMHRCIYGQTTEHPNIATTLNNLGVTWRYLGDYKKTISYLEQALQMAWNTCVCVKEAFPHKRIAESLVNLGSAWGQLGDHRKAMDYHEKGLLIYRSMYGQATAHPVIAMAFNQIGFSWIHLGDYKRAISYHEQALQIYKNMYGQGTAHPHIFKSLYNLGSAWHHLGDYRKAISYYEQALQMRRSINGQNTVHSDFANLLKNIGGAWCQLGDHRKAVSFFQEALVMARQADSQDEKLIKAMEFLIAFLKGVIQICKM
ncbi:uncharacterized protein LOC144905201 [Branchiostoma floridae x Branchiostoma belcheri]